MAVPRRRTSRSKRDSRRGHIKLKTPNVYRCPNCGEMTLPHCACKACGYYKGVEVIPQAATEEV